MKDDIEDDVLEIPEERLSGELKKMSEEDLKREILAELRLELEKMKDKIVEELAVQLKDEILSLKRQSEEEKLLSDRITSLESKVLELSKAIDGLTKDVLFLKSGKLEKKDNLSVKVKQQLKSSTKLDSEDDIIICD